jgi:adenylosuccinate lyase
MIDRYSRPEMRTVWTEQNKFQAWLEVELCACEAWAELGHIPREDVAALRKNARVDIGRIYEIEQ